MPHPMRPLDPHGSALAFFGAELRHWRVHRGLSQADLGKRVHVSGDLIRKIETAARRPPEGLAQHVDDVLGATGALARLEMLIDAGLPAGADDTRASATGRRSPPRSAAPHQPDVVDPSLADAAACSDHDSAALLSRLESSNLGAATIDHLQWQVTVIARSYVHAPLRPLFTRMLDVRRQAITLLDDTQPPGPRSDLLMVTGAVLGLLAHACDDLGQPEAAATHARAAQECARQAGHRELQAWVAGTLSKIIDSGGDHAVAARLAADARAHLRGGNQEQRLAALEARAWSHLGASREAFIALDAASDDVDDVTGEGDLARWGGVFDFPIAKRRYYAGTTLLWLGNREAAVGESTAAIAAYESGPASQRSYGDETCARADLVAAHVQAGDLTAAAQTLHTLIEIPAVNRVAGLAGHLDVARTGLQRLTTDRQVTHLLEGISRASPTPTPR